MQSMRRTRTACMHMAGYVLRKLLALPLWTTGQRARARLARLGLLSLGLERPNV